MCFGGGSVPSAPNESGYASSSNSIGNSAATAAQNLSAYTQAGAAAQNAQTGLAQNALNTAGSTNLAAGAAGANEYTNTALPAANQNIAQSQAWGSPAAVAGAQANAAATTGQAYDAARQNNMQQLGSYGVDPSQMKSGALNLNANLQKAGAVGNAAYTAGQNRQLQGINLTNQAVGTANQTAGVGAAFGQQGASNLSSATQLGNQGLATTTQAQLAPAQYDSTAISGFGSAGNLSSQQFNNQMASANLSNQENNAFMSSVGQGLGMLGGWADGGGIPKRFAQQPMRFDDGGNINVPTINIAAATSPYITPGGSGSGQGGGGMNAGVQSSQNGGTSLLSGANTLAHSIADSQPFTPQQFSVDPSTISPNLPTPQFSPQFQANGGQIKKPMYGIPQRNQQGGVPPQVGIPGPWMYANGGTPPGFIGQGPSDGTGIDDQVPARVSVGEYIVPADVVHAKGKEFFDKLLQRYHTPAEQQRQQMGVQ